MAVISRADKIEVIRRLSSINQDISTLNQTEQDLSSAQNIRKINLQERNRILQSISTDKETLNQEKMELVRLSRLPVYEELVAQREREIGEQEARFKFASAIAHKVNESIPLSLLPSNIRKFFPQPINKPQSISLKPRIEGQIISQSKPRTTPNLHSKPPTMQFRELTRGLNTTQKSKLWRQFKNQTAY